MTEAAPSAVSRNFASSGTCCEIGEVEGLAAFPNTAEQAFAGIDRVRTEITVQRDRRRGRLLQDAVGHFDQRRAALGKKCRLQARPGAIGDVKRPTVRIEDADRAFDDQAMQIMRPDDIAKGFAEAVEEIENEIFLDLDFLVRAFEAADAPRAAADKSTASRRAKRRAARKEESAWERSEITSLGFRVGGLV